MTVAETLTRKEELVSIYWDFYKEVYNVRPRWIDFDSCTEAELVEMLGRLDEQAKKVFAEQEEAEKLAIIKFETCVDALLACGAETRADALRWLMDASSCNGDWDFLCWQHGLPYGYFNK